VLDVKFNAERTLPQSDILAGFSSGALRFADSTGASSEATSTSTPVALPDLSEADQAQLVARWQAVAPLTALGHKPTDEEFQTRAEQLRMNGVRFSSRTLRRLYATWSKSGQQRLSLLTRTHQRGGRGRSRRHSWLKRFPTLRQLVERAIADVYLTMARRPISAVVRRVIDDLQRHNARLPASQAIPIPRTAALSRAIAREIRRLDPWEVDRARWGRHIADRRHSPTSPQRLATRILERVEIDHTPLKVVVGTEAGPLGQPWLTVLVDYYSRMIVGFCIGFEPPSYAVIMEALRHAILPKSDIRHRFPSVQGDWPCFGIPSKLVCDRGGDLTSKDLEQAAFQLGIELDFMPPRTPNFKGTVESFFDSLNDQLLSALPGRTFRSWEKRGDYQPDDGPLLSYHALVEIIHVHLIDVYSRQRHPTATKSRLDMWLESAAEFPPALPASPDELLVLLSKTIERSLSARGIELSGMFYTSDELMALRAELAAHNLNADRLTVRYNPWDLGAVWVLNPINRRYLKAASVDSALIGLTEYQWRVLRRAVREKFDEPEHLLSLAAARNSIRDLVEKAIQKPTKRRRARAARFLGNYQSNPHSDLENAGNKSSALVATSPDEPASDSFPQQPASASSVPSPVITPSEPLYLATDELDVESWDVAV
jgi:putative transposase